jgi:hypothetical protein
MPCSSILILDVICPLLTTIVRHPPFSVPLIVAQTASLCCLPYHHGHLFATAAGTDVYCGVFSGGLSFQCGVLSMLLEPACKTAWPKARFTHVLV